MDGNQSVSDTAGDLSAIPNIRDLVARSMRAKVVGSGKEGVVYEFDEDAITRYPILKNFLIKRYRLIADIPMVSGRLFEKSLAQSTDLLELPDPFDGRNFGQPVLKDDRGQFAILLKQEGVSLNKWIREVVCGGENWGPTKRYDNYLEWLRKIPDEAIIDLADKVAFLKSRGYALDATQKGNVLWDDASQRFNIVDVVAEVVDAKAELDDPLRRIEVIKKPFQVAVSSAFGIHNANISDSVSALLKDVTKHITMHFDLMSKDKQTSFMGVTALEALLDDRIATLDLDNKFKDKYPYVGRAHKPAAEMPAITMNATTMQLAGKLGEVHDRVVRT